MGKRVKSQSTYESRQKENFGLGESRSSGPTSPQNLVNVFLLLHPKSSAHCLTSSTCQKGGRECARERETEMLVLPAETKAKFLPIDLTGVNMACKLH